MDSTAWQTGGSLVGIGLDIKHSLSESLGQRRKSKAFGAPLTNLLWRFAVVVLVGNCLIAVPIILNGAIGSQLR